MDTGLLGSRDVARVVGIGAGRLAYWVKTGLITPSVKRGGRQLFCFEDLIAVKAATELTARGVSLQAVRKNLRALRGALPPPASLEEQHGPDGALLPAAPLPPTTRPLSRLRVVSDGEQLVVVEHDVAFEPLSGQVVMDFVVGALSARAAEVLALPAPARERTAWEWFREGLALDERGLPDRAEEALRRALEVDPTLAAAHNNLGLIAHRAGRRGEALAHYQRALGLDPELPEARFNHANLLDEEGDQAGAIDGWSRVVAACPDFADAHFNLGAALTGREPNGSEAARARWHLLRYLELDATGEWADVARVLMQGDMQEETTRPAVP